MVELQTLSDGQIFVFNGCKYKKIGDRVIGIRCQNCFTGLSRYFPYVMLVFPVV